MKRVKNVILGCLMFTLAFLISGFRAEAAGPAGTVTNLKQVDDGGSWVDLEFTALLDNKAYYSVQISTSKNGTYSEWTTCDSGKVGLNNLPNAGTSYWVKVVPFYSEWDSNISEYVREYGLATAPIEVVTTPNGDVTNLIRTGVTETSQTFTWDATSGANCYLVKYKVNGASNDSYVNTYVNTNAVTLTGLSKNTRYDITVYAARKSETDYYAYGDYVSDTYSVLASKPDVNELNCTDVWNFGRVDMKYSGTYTGTLQYELWTAYKAEDVMLLQQDEIWYDDGVGHLEHDWIEKGRMFKVRCRGYLTINNKRVYGEYSDWFYVGYMLSSVTAKSTENGITISWAKGPGADSYDIYMSTTKDGDYEYIGNTKDLTYTVTKFKNKKLTEGTTYYYSVHPMREENGVVIKNQDGWGYRQSIVCKYTTSSKVKVTKPSLKATASTSSVKLSWKKVSGAKGYQVQMYGDSAYGKSKTISKTYYTKSKLKAGTKYKFRVRSYKIVDGKKHYSDWVTKTVITKPSKVKTPKAVSNKTKQIKVSWSAVKGATKYQVHVSTNKKFTNKISLKTTKNKSYTFKKLKKGKTYYVKVRAYNSSGYGAWSSAKKIKCK